MMDTMPFGKFRNKPIAERKTDYLNWLLGRDYIRDPLKSAIEEELKRREAAQNGSGKAAHLGCPSAQLAAEIIAEGLRVITQRDGEREKMIMVNKAADWLRAQLRGAK